MSFPVFLLEEEEQSRHSIFYHLFLMKKNKKNSSALEVICSLFVYFRLNSAITMSFTVSDCVCCLQSAAVKDVPNLS